MLIIGVFLLFIGGVMFWLFWLSLSYYFFLISLFFLYFSIYIIIYTYFSTFGTTYIHLLMYRLLHFWFKDSKIRLNILSNLILLSLYLYIFLGHKIIWYLYLSSWNNEVQICFKNVFWLQCPIFTFKIIG